MNPTHLSKIKTEFSSEDAVRVTAELGTITTAHTMNSQANLDSTISAILKLCDGNVDEARSLVKAAKIDFRDVAYWASLERTAPDYEAEFQDVLSWASQEK